MTGSHPPDEPPEPARASSRSRLPDALWDWIPASLRAAFDQIQSEPDSEDGFKGKLVKHERPHLVPIGYVLLFTPFVFLADLVDQIVMPSGRPRVTFLAVWIPFAITGLLWSAGIFIAHRRARRRK